MSLLGATILSAIATVVLALGAIVTGVLAWLAFRKQSEEVRTIQRQLDVQHDQFESLKKISTKQAVVLELQARDLQKSLDQREREAEDRRQGQAMAVTTWLAEDEHPLGGTLLAAVLSNQSSQPIYDVQAYLHYMEDYRLGSEWEATMGGASAVIKMVAPHSDLHVGLSREASPYPEEDDGMAYRPSIMFTDAFGNRWERNPRGVLNPVSPDAAYPVTR